MGIIEIVEQIVLSRYKTVHPPSYGSASIKIEGPIVLSTSKTAGA